MFDHFVDLALRNSLSSSLKARTVPVEGPFGQAARVSIDLPVKVPYFMLPLFFAAMDDPCSSSVDTFSFLSLRTSLTLAECD